MEAQLQIRHNAQEAQDEAQDLLRWTKQQQVKEAKLKETRSAGGSTRKAAPVRSGFSFQQAVPTPDRQGPPVKSQQPVAAHAAGHTYDNYSRRWDSFDPDKVTAPASENEIRPQTQPEDQAARNKELAASMQRKQNQPKLAEAQMDDLEWKERGNELFKKGSFAEAKTAYSRSLSKNRTAVVHANRAQACLKLGQAAQADKDCSEALELDMQYIKAWQRRGTARKLLGNHFGAAEDFEQALRLQPESRLLASERAACLTAFLKAEGLTPSRQSTCVPITPAAATPSSEHLTDVAPSQSHSQPPPQQQQQMRGSGTAAVRSSSASARASQQQQQQQQSPGQSIPIGQSPAAGTSHEGLLPTDPPGSMVKTEAASGANDAGSRVCLDAGSMDPSQAPEPSSTKQPVPRPQQRPQSGGAAVDGSTPHQQQSPAFNDKQVPGLAPLKPVQQPNDPDFLQQAPHGDHGLDHHNQQQQQMQQDGNPGQAAAPDAEAVPTSHMAAHSEPMPPGPMQSAAGLEEDVRCGHEASASRSGVHVSAQQPPQPQQQQQQHPMQADGGHHHDGHAASVQPRAPSNAEQQIAAEASRAGQMSREPNLKAAGTSHTSPADDHSWSSQAAAGSLSPAAKSSSNQARFKAPRTGSEFELAWRGFKGNTHLQAAYLAQIPSSTIPSLFKLSLPPATMTSVLKALLEQLLPSEHIQGLAHLEALRCVNRFDMTVMCLPSRDKKLLGALWPNSVRAQEIGLDGSQVQQLAALRKAFCL
ncbi:hypothetical protein WJX74_007299 [Apatococcus lobatus]|uniref:RNA-polymerase II-associated protein 3-like C-terminal domain-containing protein n=1 Tax=Apatococcus lobatus TaxID=904363 RepID=A0AAW1RC51_9CHLO